MFVLLLTFTYMHSADAFIQSDFQERVLKSAKVTDHNNEIAPNIAGSHHEAYIVKTKRVPKGRTIRACS